MGQLRKKGYLKVILLVKLLQEIVGAKEKKLYTDYYR
jgi:hypothetical protein